MGETNVSELGNVHSRLFLWCRAGEGKPGYKGWLLVLYTGTFLVWTRHKVEIKSFFHFHCPGTIHSFFLALVLLTAFMVGCFTVIICITVFVPLYSFRAVLNTFQRVKWSMNFLSNGKIMSCVLASYMLICLEGYGAFFCSDQGGGCALYFVTV